VIPWSEVTEVKRFLLGVVVIVLVGGGFAAGFIYSRQFPGSTGSSDDVPRVRFYPEDASVFTAPPGWEEWRYPDSKVHRFSDSATMTDHGVQFSTSAQAVLTTPDDFDKVCDYYKRKCDLRPPGASPAIFKDYGSGLDKDFWLVIYDTRNSNWLVGPDSPSGKHMGFDVSTTRYHLAGFVYRGERDDVTQVMLALRPQTEFLSVAKLLRGQGETPRPPQ
jgi:hypothetical protein